MSLSKSKRKRKPKKKPPPPPEPEPVDEEVVIEEEELTPEERAVQGWKESVSEVPPELLQALKMYVSRRRPTEFEGYKTDGYLGILECGADYYEVLEAVRERFGGGVYLVQLRVKGRISMGHTVHVAGPPIVGTLSADKKGMQWAPEVIGVVTNMDERLKAVEGKVDSRPSGVDEMIQTYSAMHKLFAPKTTAPPRGSEMRAVIEQMKDQRELEALMQDRAGAEPEEGEEEVDEEDIVGQIEGFVERLGTGIERATEIFDQVFPASTQATIRKELAQIREFMAGGMKAAAMAKIVAARAGPGLLEQLKRHGPEGLAGLMRGAGVEVSDEEKGWLGAFVRAL